MRKLNEIPFLTNTCGRQRFPFSNYAFRKMTAAFRAAGKPA
jgi:hypothetical protein